MEEGEDTKHRSKVANQRDDEGGCMDKDKVRTIVINRGRKAEEEAQAEARTTGKGEWAEEETEEDAEAREREGVISEQEFEGQECR